MMPQIFILVFILIIAILLFFYIRDHLLNKKEDEAKESEKSWIIPIILAALVAQNLMSQNEANELESRTIMELEDELLERNIFESHQDFEQWVRDQSDMAQNDAMPIEYSNHDL